MDVTTFEQDGVVYAAISHRAPPNVLAKIIASEIRYMGKVPRSKMRVITVDEFRVMPFGTPKRN